MPPPHNQQCLESNIADRREDACVWALPLHTGTVRMTQQLYRGEGASYLRLLCLSGESTHGQTASMGF